MKFIALFSLSLIGSLTIAFCEVRNRDYPFPDSFPTMAPFVSSATAADSSVNGSEVLVSTNAGVLRRIVIEAGGTSSRLTCYNSSVSTASTNRMLADIDSTSKVSLDYDVPYSSGIACRNAGSPPARVNIIYLEWNLKR